jgi:hypothetical protein
VCLRILEISLNEVCSVFWPAFQKNLRNGLFRATTAYFCMIPYLIVTMRLAFKFKDRHLIVSESMTIDGCNVGDYIVEDIEIH